MAKLVVLLGFCGAFILFGLLSAAASLSDFRYGQQSLSWPSTEGEITQSVRRRGSRLLKSLEYRYTVGTTTYVGTRAAFMRTPYVKPIHETYRTGQRVGVHYDPTDPGRAVLEPGVPILAVIAESLVPILLIIVGSAGLFYGLRRRDVSFSAEPFGRADSVHRFNRFAVRSALWRNVDSTEPAPPIPPAHRRSPRRHPRTAYKCARRSPSRRHRPVAG